jgi:ubiquinone/menaquinone biosynthesis methyltransferase
MSAPPTMPVAAAEARRGVEAAHQSAARGMFDRIAPTYDLLNRLLSAGIDTRWRRLATEAVCAAPSGPLLDLCAGTLDLTAQLVRKRPGDRVVAVDFSPAMLEAGRHKAPGAEMLVADALALPFEDATFAGVVCGFGMRNLADTARGVREVLRVLRPGGVFVTLDLFRPATAFSRAFHAAYAKVVLPSLGGVVSGDRGAYRYLAESMAGFLSLPEYESLLGACGFTRVRGRNLTMGIASLATAEASQ